MNFLIDTNVLIYSIQKACGELFHNFLFQLAQRGSLVVSVVSRFELLAGSIESRFRDNQEFLDSFPVVTLGKEIADRAGRLFRDYRKRGLTFDNEDLLLAATALEERLTIVTTNLKHFPSFVPLEQHSLTFPSRKGPAETKILFLLNPVP